MPIFELFLVVEYSSASEIKLNNFKTVVIVWLI